MNEALTQDMVVENNETEVAAAPALFNDTQAERDALWKHVKQLKDNKKGYLSYLVTKFNIDRSKALQVYSYLEAGKSINEVINAMPDIHVENPVDLEDDGVESGIEDYGNYVYNEVNDKYIVPLKSFGGDFICTGEQHRAMKAAFSNWSGDAKTYAELAKENKMHIDWVKEYFRIMNWTHDSSPVTDEEIATGDVEKALERVFQQKKAQVEQDLRKRDWDNTQKDAIRWRQFIAGKLDPFERVVKNYVPEALKPLEAKKLPAKATKNVFVVGLSDLHFGGKANAVELYDGADFNTQTITDIIDEYAGKVQQDVKDRGYNFSKCVLVVVGDVLHTLTGFTEKGTKLESSVLREDQYELAFKVLNQFITRMHEIFGNLEIHVVKGNHAGPSEYILFDSLRNYYRTTPTMSFTLYRSRAALFRILNTAILLDHGDSEYIHAKVPSNPKQREAYIQQRFLQYPEKLVGCTSKIMIQGDMHHFEQKEHTGFEFFMFGSPVTGDRYSDHMGFKSRPRQNCLVINEDGVKEVLHYYFDR